jgi:hypothetical protein
MMLETTEWTTTSEAARLLGVSTQRVAAMADEGLLDIQRPWPHTALIGRRSLAERLAGTRPERIAPADARRWLLKRSGAKTVQEIDVNDVRDRLRDFIEETRPRWDNSRKDLWALNMASKLWRSGAAT